MPYQPHEQISSFNVWLGFRTYFRGINRKSQIVNTRIILQRLLLLLSLTTFIFCKGNKSNPASPAADSAPPPALPVEAMIVRTQPLSATIEVPGTLLAFETTEIHPEVSGRLVNLNVTEGGIVAQGTLRQNFMSATSRHKCENWMSNLRSPSKQKNGKLNC